MGMRVRYPAARVLHFLINIMILSQMFTSFNEVVGLMENSLAL